MEGELAVKHGCYSSPSVDARPPRLMWMDSRMPRWHGCQRAAMGRTVVSRITMAHLFSISLTCRFKSPIQHALGQKRVRTSATSGEFRIRIYMEITPPYGAHKCLAKLSDEGAQAKCFASNYHNGLVINRLL